MNCSNLDSAYETTLTLLTSETGTVVYSSLLGVGGLALMLFGYLIARPTACFIAGIAASVAVFVVTDTADLNCVMRLVVSGLGGLVACLVALCLVRNGMFILGAIGFGVVSHYVYATIPVDESTAPFVAWDKSAYYWSTITGSALLGAVLTCLMKQTMLVFSTAFIGASLFAVGVAAASDRFGDGIHEAAVLAIIIGPGTCGVFAQMTLQRHMRQKKKKLQRQKRDLKRDLKLENEDSGPV